MVDYPAVLHYFDDLHSSAGPSAEVQKRYEGAKRSPEGVDLRELEREMIISSWDTMINERIPEMMLATRNGFAIPNFDKVWIGHAVPCLGTTRTRSGLLPHKETMDLLEKLDEIKTRDEMRRALGLVRYVTPSVPMLAASLALWNSLTSTKKEFQWTPEAARLVSDLKQRLKDAVVRAPPDPKLPLLSYCDASTMGCGGIIFQLADDGQPRILRCWSTAHGPAMASRPPTELELNALYLHLVKIETYVNMLGEPEFDVYTDHLPLLKVLEHRDATKLRTMRRTVIERQLAYIAQFPTLRLQYVKGPSNLADVFTRPPFVRAPTLEALGLSPTESAELVACIYNVPVQEEAQRVSMAGRSKRGQKKKKEIALETQRREPALEMEQLLSALKDIEKEEAVSDRESNLGEAETPTIQAVPPKDKDEVTSVTPESVVKREPEQTHVSPAAAEEVVAPSGSTAVASRMVPVDSCGQELIAEDSPALPKDATESKDKRILVAPRRGKSLFWDETRSLVRLDVFNLDVFEQVAIERLSGRDTPSHYNNALFAETLRDVERHLPHLELRSGRLYHTEVPTGYYLSEVVKDDVYWASHAAPTGGHYGLRGTLKRLEGIAWRPNISADIKRMVDTCELCMRNKSARPPGRDGALPSVAVGERVHIDIIIVPVEAVTGERVIAQAIDSASRWITSKALHTRETKSVCEWFYNDWILVKGIPQRVTIDGEGALISKTAECLFDLMGVHLRVTSPDNPMSNGVAERPHRHYMEMIKCLAMPDMSNWPNFVSAADFAHNTHTPRSTGVSPFFLEYGRKPFTLLNVYAGVLEPGPDVTDATAVAQWHHTLTRARELAANMEGRARGAPTSKELEQSAEPLLRPGDLFLVAADQGKSGPKYVGPYRVLESKTDSEGLSALLENVADSSEVIWRNRRKLRPYKGQIDAPATGREWELSEILAERGSAPEDEYYVSFKGYGPEDNLWLPRDNIHAVELLAAWRRKSAKERRALSDAVLRNERGILEPAPARPVDERIVVERVLESKTTRAGKRYLVVPQGSGPNDQLWVRAMDVANPEILQ
jgi:hypothetical protein